jgi:hypothetical protein
MEGRTDPIVCIGYEETATVKFVSFQPNSTLLVRKRGGIRMQPLTDYMARLWQL